MFAANLSNRSMHLAAIALASFPLTACAAHRVAPPIAPAAPQAQERVLIADNFREYNPRWRQVRGQWGVVGGAMVQTRDDARELNTMMFYDPVTISDADITTEATVLADLPQFQTVSDDDLLNSKRRIAGVGVVFRYQDENNFYLFRTAGEEGVVMGKVVNGEWYELANPRAADFSGNRLQTDTPYNLRVRVVGDRIQCWIGDRAVVNLEDTSFATGRVGLATFRSKAAFTGLRVVEK